MRISGKKINRTWFNLKAGLLKWPLYNDNQNFIFFIFLFFKPKIHKAQVSIHSPGPKCLLLILFLYDWIDLHCQHVIIWSQNKSVPEIKIITFDDLCVGTILWPLNDIPAAHQIASVQQGGLSLPLISTQYRLMMQDRNAWTRG